MKKNLKHVFRAWKLSEIVYGLVAVAVCAMCYGEEDDE